MHLYPPTLPSSSPGRAAPGTTSGVELCLCAWAVQTALAYGSETKPSAAASSGLSSCRAFAHRSFLRFRKHSRAASSALHAAFSYTVPRLPPAPFKTSVQRPIAFPAVEGSKESFLRFRLPPKTLAGSADATPKTLPAASSGLSCCHPLLSLSGLSTCLCPKRLRTFAAASNAFRCLSVPLFLTVPRLLSVSGLCVACPPVFAPAPSSEPSKRFQTFAAASNAFRCLSVLLFTPVPRLLPPPKTLAAASSGLSSFQWPLLLTVKPLLLPAISEWLVHLSMPLPRPSKGLRTFAAAPSAFRCLSVLMISHGSETAACPPQKKNSLQLPAASPPASMVFLTDSLRSRRKEMCHYKWTPKTAQLLQFFTSTCHQVWARHSAKATATTPSSAQKN